jgi:hypothetical protein
MAKIIRLTESDLEKIVKQVLKEQSKGKPITAPAATLTPDQPQQQSSLQPTTNAASGTYNSTTNSTTSKLPQKFTCVTPELSAAAQYTISHGVDPFYVKYAMGILGRESDFGKVMGKYGLKAAPEYIMNKMSEDIPGFKDLLQWGAKKVFGKSNWVPSMGVAQMTPDIAKKYNVDLEQLMSVSGSLFATSRYLIDLYKQLSSYYDTNKPSKIIYNKQLIDNPSSTGNAALDAAIMSYNLGASKFTKTYCKTNNPEFMAPCESPNGIYLPYPKDNPNFKLTVDKNQVIKNYVPTIKTKTGDNQYISNTGYLKEVVGHANKFTCIK